jgi:3-(3-hydroxy-phenyl)propionate hydroxylase
LLSLADADDGGVAAALAELTAMGLACRHIRVVAQRDDFLKQAQPTETLRDCGGTLEAIIRSAGAQAVLLRPDRYVLAYLRRGDADTDTAARLRQLLRGQPASILQAA